MRPKRFSIRLTATLAMFAVTLFVTRTWAAPQETVLYSFTGGSDGDQPYAGLVFDGAGINLYGTTPQGGSTTNCNNGCGVVFELTPKAGGGWTEKVLYSFTGGSDGAAPYAGLIFDASGNLYGTTYGGGTNAFGTVFELTPKAGGGWTETVLHSFGNGKDGAEVHGGLIFDASGNLYGTTVAGGAHGKGTVFELTPKAGGGWTEKVLHSFGSFGKNGKDGAGPQSGLIFDQKGNLYGTTYVGVGRGYGNGTVFELTPKAGGGWTEKVLHTFCSVKQCTDGQYPFASLIFDGADLYGATPEGGLSDCLFGCGVVFKLTPNLDGSWTETVLYTFVRVEGKLPSASLIFDASGNLYSTTYRGGTNAYGTVFELAPKAGGGWTEKVLHFFKGGDGGDPSASLIFDAIGNLYGTTSGGGAYSHGTVFKITP